MKRIIYLLQCFLNITYVCFGQAPSNDLCVNAIPLSCGETLTISPHLANTELDDFGCGRIIDPDLWYVVEGNNELYTFEIVNGIMDIQILKGSCGSECIERFILFDNPPQFSPTFTIKFNQGIDYYISINSVGSGSDVSFSTSCINVSENDECEDAIPLVCGDLYTLNTALAAPTTQDNDCVNSMDNDLWFSFTATSDFLRLEYVNGDQFQIPIIIYETNTCLPDPILCNQFSFSDSFTAIIPVVNGSNYLIRFLSDDRISQGNEFTFQANCVNFDMNTSCLTAQQFNCGDTLFINTNLADQNGQDMICESEVGFFPPSPIIGSWFSFEGFDNEITFTVPEGDFTTDLYVRVSDNICSDNISCTDEFFVQSITDFEYSFFAESNIIYYFNFLPFNNVARDIEFIQIICDPESNPNLNNIPTLNEWSLVILALLLLILSTISLKQIKTMGNKRLQRS